MASAQPSSELHQVVSFLSAALQRVRCIHAGGSSSSSSRSISDAASAVSNACDALKPQLVRLSIVLSAGPASPSTINSFCSDHYPTCRPLRPMRLHSSRALTRCIYTIALSTAPCDHNAALQVVHGVVAPSCANALQALHALYAAIARVQEGSEPSLDPSLNNFALRALSACKVRRCCLSCVVRSPL